MKIIPLEGVEDRFECLAASEKQSLEVSIVMPCLNEAETLSICQNCGYLICVWGLVLSVAIATTVELIDLR